MPWLAFVAATSARAHRWRNFGPPHGTKQIGPDCGRAPCPMHSTGSTGIRQQGSHLVHVRAVLCCCGRNDGVICSH